MKGLLALVLLLASPAALAAGSNMAGKVGFIHTMGSGLVYVDIIEPIKARTNVPACSNYPVRFVFDATTAGGQVMFKALMAANDERTNIVVAGTGTCMPGGYEIVDYFGIYPLARND
jgi:hypothetical protein